MNWQEKRRSNRVDLEPGKELSVHLLDPGSGDQGVTLVAAVRNVSVRGCRLFFSKAADLKRVKAGQVLVASLVVDGFSIPLQLEILRAIEPSEAAVKFKPPFPRELSRLEKFLEPRQLGLSLREIDRSKLQNAEKGLRWFQGVNDTHLFTWSDASDKKIVQQQLIFLEKVLEWSEGAQVRTGHVRADRPAGEGGYRWAKSELMEFDATPNQTVIKEGRTLLESASIDAAVKSTFLKNLGS